MRISDDNGKGWVNENVFFGGGIWSYNGIVQGAEGITQQSTSKFHNNKFYNIEFEGIYGGDAIVFHQARSNAVLYPRFEGSGIPLASLLIKEGAACAKNIYQTSYYAMEISQIALNTSGTAL